jgi:hypothetical protein
MRGTAGRAATAYRRTALAGITSVAALLWGLGAASGQDAGPAATATPFSNGQAKATAVVARVAPGVGSLELALANGIAVSELKNSLAQAQAQSIDLGLIGTTLTAGGCRNPTITPDQLPQPTRVDNRKGSVERSTDEVALADSALGAGRELARATTQPLAGAVSTTAASFGPVLTLNGGRAEATTEVVDGAARQAHAIVEAGFSIAGVLDLRGLRWEALHRTGADPAAEASFDIGTARLLGLEIPLDSLHDLEGVVNETLAQLGLGISFPKVQRFTEPADLIRITPLRIVLKDSPVGKTLLSPVLDLTREQRSQMFDTLAASICDAAGLLLVGDIGVSIASGTGFLAIEVGGAEATSGELELGNPFGEAVAPSSSPGPPVLTPSSPSFAPSGPVAAPVAPPTPAAPPAARPTPVADVGPLEALCETIHPFASPSCSEGAMAPLGLLGLLATVGVAGLDWRHQRKRLVRPAATPAVGA